MKTISQVVDEITNEISAKGGVEPDPGLKQIVEKIVKLACREFQYEIIVDKRTKRPRSGVTNELLDRCLAFLESK